MDLKLDGMSVRVGSRVEFPVHNKLAIAEQTSGQTNFGDLVDR